MKNECRQITNYVFYVKNYILKLSSLDYPFYNDPNGSFANLCSNERNLGRKANLR